MPQSQHPNKNVLAVAELFKVGVSLSQMSWKSNTTGNKVQYIVRSSKWSKEAVCLILHRLFNENEELDKFEVKIFSAQAIRLQHFSSMAQIKYGSAQGSNILRLSFSALIARSR